MITTDSTLQTINSSFPARSVLSSFSEDFKRRLIDLSTKTEIERRIAVFDLDHTLLTSDIGHATFEKLVDSGQLRTEKLPANLREIFGIELSNKDNLAEVYNSIASHIETHSNQILSTEKLYKWMSMVYYGLSPYNLVNAASEVIEDKKYSSDSLQARTPMIDLISTLSDLDYSIWVISASNPCVVRTAIKSLVNPLLEQAGANTIPMQQVIGMSPYLIDTMGEKISDRDLVLKDRNYANLIYDRLQHYIFDEELYLPASTFSGKAECCREFLPHTPLLVAGDSINDLSMLGLAKIKLWVNRSDKTYDLDIAKKEFSECCGFFAENI